MSSKPKQKRTKVESSQEMDLESSVEKNRQKKQTSRQNLSTNKQQRNISPSNINKPNLQVKKPIGKISITPPKGEKDQKGQQNSLDSFVIKSTQKQRELLLNQLKQKTQQNEKAIKSEIKPSQGIIKKFQAPKESFPKSLVTNWEQKVKSIKSIKGYTMRNNEIFYQIESWDKNGQKLFIPPLPSATVKRMDQLKVANFLQECLINGCNLQQKQKNSQANNL